MIQLLEYLSLPVTLLGIFAINAMSLQLILGGAGLLSLGHAAYFAVGGYSSAAFVVYAAPALGIADPMLLMLSGLTVGFLTSALAGILVAIPCLRLSGDYLAMATLGFSEIVSTILKNIESLGGTRGFKDIPRLSSPLFVWAGVILVAWFLTRFYKSHWGVAIKATRDDEIAARSIGISTRYAKVVAFTLGTAIAGLAGSFFAHTLEFISPESASFQQSVEILLAVVIGGMFSLRGSVLGAVILVLLPEALRFAPPLVSQNRMLIFSAVVIIIMLFNPKGLSAVFEKLLMRRNVVRQNA